MAGRNVGDNQGLRLDGKRILVVEDEYFIADDIQRVLTRVGATVVGPCPTLDKALAAVEQEGFDLALIDLNLHGENAIPVAEQLAGCGRPFAIATGYGSPAVPERFRKVPRIEKPFDAAALLNLMGRLTGVPTE